MVGARVRVQEGKEGERCVQEAATRAEGYIMPISAAVGAGDTEVGHGVTGKAKMREYKLPGSGFDCGMLSREDHDEVCGERCCGVIECRRWIGSGGGG